MKAIEETEKNPEVAAEDGNIDKIRDILFGVQVREFEQNFSKLEERFNKEVEDLRAETRTKLDKLEQLITKESNSLTDKILVEQDSRNDAFKTLSGEIEHASHGLDEKISKLTELTEKKESEIRTQIFEQSKALTDSIQTKQEEVFSALEREARELRDDKTDRAALAELFVEMAKRLNGDSDLPASEHEIESQDAPQ